MTDAATYSDARILFRCACAAIVVVGLTIHATGWRLHWFAHPTKTRGLDPDNFIEAQVVRLPEHDHLTSPVPTRRLVSEEPTVSAVPERGRNAPKTARTAPEENVTTRDAEDTHASLAATHGPVAVYTPPPELPSYLTSEALEKSVVIEFFVTAQGAVIPRLVTSSDNDELDALALEAVKKWQFRPAEEEHRAVDAKVRLRIEFEVR